MIQWLSGKETVRGREVVNGIGKKPETARNSAASGASRYHNIRPKRNVTERPVATKQRKQYDLKGAEGEMKVNIYIQDVEIHVPKLCLLWSPLEYNSHTVSYVTQSYFYIYHLITKCQQNSNICLHISWI